MYADNVASALYLCAAVRRAAVNRYFLPMSAAFAAVAHAGTDRRKDTLPCFIDVLRYCRKLVTSLPQESKRIDKFHNTVLV